MITPLERLQKRFWSRVKKGDGRDACWVWQASCTRDGYGQIGYRYRKYGTHRIAWFLHHGAHSKVWVLHKCDNKKCVRPSHLFEGTALDNTRDMDRKGRRRCNPCFGDRNGMRTKPESIQRGEKASAAKLTASDVRAIRTRYQYRVPGSGLAALAEEFGIGISQTFRIVKRESWGHVQ